jgi:hypothetical protein
MTVRQSTQSKSIPVLDVQIDSCIAKLLQSNRISSFVEEAAAVASAFF